MLGFDDLVQVLRDLFPKDALMIVLALDVIQKKDDAGEDPEINDDLKKERGLLRREQKVERDESRKHGKRGRRHGARKRPNEDQDEIRKEELRRDQLIGEMDIEFQ